jgi:hypothetical protein
LHIVVPPTLPIEQLRRNSVLARVYVLSCDLCSGYHSYGGFRVVVLLMLPIEQRCRWIAPAKNYVRRCAPVEQQTSF